jgi:hypothetical protein
MFILWVLYQRIERTLVMPLNSSFFCQVFDLKPKRVIQGLASFLLLIAFIMCSVETMTMELTAACCFFCNNNLVQKLL